MAKFRATFTLEYETPDDELMKVYDSDDPEKCAQYDAASIKDDPIDFFTCVDGALDAVVTVIQ